MERRQHKLLNPKPMNPRVRGFGVCNPPASFPPPVVCSARSASLSLAGSDANRTPPHRPPRALSRGLSAARRWARMSRGSSRRLNMRLSVGAEKVAVLVEAREELSTQLRLMCAEALRGKQRAVHRACKSDSRRLSPPPPPPGSDEVFDGFLPGIEIMLCAELQLFELRFCKLDELLVVSPERFGAHRAQLRRQFLSSLDEYGHFLGSDRPLMFKRRLEPRDIRAHLRAADNPCDCSAEGKADEEECNWHPSPLTIGSGSDGTIGAARWKESRSTINAEAPEPEGSSASA